MRGFACETLQLIWQSDTDVIRTTITLLSSKIPLPQQLSFVPTFKCTYGTGYVQHAQKQATFQLFGSLHWTLPSPGVPLHRPMSVSAQGN